MPHKKVLLIMHQAHSDPGRVGQAIRTLGHELDMRIPAIGDPLPDDVHEHKAAVVFGGPMSANDDHEEFIRVETKYVERAIEGNLPFFGICLGAQIMARVLGANVSRHPEGRMEIGYHKVTPTEAGSDYFDKEIFAYQWHKEGFDLPDGATLLASGEHFPNQAYRYGSNAYGIQFHPEVTEAMNRRWLNKAAHMLVEPGAQAADDQLRSRPHHDPILGQWLDNFLGGWLGPPSDQV